MTMRNVNFRARTRAEINLFIFAESQPKMTPSIGGNLGGISVINPNPDIG